MVTVLGNSGTLPHGAASKGSAAAPTDAAESTAGVSPLGYFASSHLTKHVSPLQDIDLELPDAANAAVAGTMVLDLWVDATGVVIRTEIQRSDFAADYSQAVAALFGRSLYSPGEINGVPVNSIFRVEIHSDALVNAVTAPMP